MVQIACSVTRQFHDRGFLIAPRPAYVVGTPERAVYLLGGGAPSGLTEGSLPAAPKRTIASRARSLRR